MENILFQTKELWFHDFIRFPDISIPEGQVTFIVGKSGAGKSTLFRLLNGTLTQSKGDILYFGKNTLESDPIALRKEISLISQSVFLFDLSIRENFSAFYHFRDLSAPSDKTLNFFLELCRIPFSLGSDCSTMSGGERQRIYMAIFLSFLPKVIMLDEPTSALDRDNGHEVMKNILDFCRDKKITPLIISHDDQLTQTYAQKIIAIDRGGCK